MLWVLYLNVDIPELCKLHKYPACLQQPCRKRNIDKKPQEENAMNSLDQPQPPSTSPISQPIAPSRKPRLARTRRWLRSRGGRVIVPGVALVLGVGIGVVGLLLYALSLSTEGRVLVTPLPPPGGDIIVQVGTTYITRLLIKDLQSSDLPGSVENVRVMLADSDRIHSAQMTIIGDEQIGVFGIGATRPFTIVVQPFIRDCQLQVNVLHADFSGVTVTGFAATFEGQINQQLEVKPGGLPAGFQYCTTNVRTKPQALFLTYSATPIGD